MIKRCFSFLFLGALAFSASSWNEPGRVRVQHILIAFQGTIPEKQICRTREEAEPLARALFDRALKGEDFNALVKECTDTNYPGVYDVVNFGVPYDSADPEVLPRDKISKSFGDVAFSLKVSEIGLVAYDPVAAKYGWHIIKRLK